MNQNHFDLEIISPTSTLSFQIEWVEVEGINGCFLVGPCHSPLISIIKKGNSLVYKRVDSEGNTEMFVGGGIFSVERNKAVVVLDF